MKVVPELVRRVCWGVLPGLVGFSLLTACQRPAQPVPDREGSGIVSAVPNTTELLWAVGLGGTQTGRTQWCDFPAEVQSIQVVGDGMTMDMERVLRLNPGAVVATEAQQHAEWITFLRESGVRVVVVPDETLEDIPVALRMLGSELGAPLAEPTAQAFETRLQELRSLPEPAVRPRVLMVVGHDPVFAAGPESRMDELLRLAGGQNALATGDWVQMDAETLLQTAPEMVVDLSDGDLPVLWSEWSALRAVSEGALCGVDADVISRPGPRILGAVDRIAACLAEFGLVGGAEGSR
jgi:ABC-type hemin transport system substrate-binding protein